MIIDVTGYTVDAATRELEGPESQLLVVTQEDPSCTAADPPIVTTQSIPPGEAPIHSDGHPDLLLRPLTRPAPEPVEGVSAARAVDGCSAAPRAAASVNPDRLEPVAQQPVPALGEHRLGVELHAQDRRRAVRDAHDDAGSGAAGHHEVGGERLGHDRERVIPGGGERVGQAGVQRRCRRARRARSCRA